jgi:HEPN domain-containing protein
LSPSPEHVEYAETLLRLADADLYAGKMLADADDLAGGAVGFHAQQAVEKALKVAIVLAEAELPRTHDLEQLKEQSKPWEHSSPPSLRAPHLHALTCDETL